MGKIRIAGMPIYKGVESLEALGKPTLKKIRIQKGENSTELPVEMFFLHEGIVLNIQITRQLGRVHRYYRIQRYWKPLIDDWKNTSIVGD